MKKIDILKTTENIGQEVTLAGWVHSMRKMGKMVFIDLRDRSAKAQVVFLPNNKKLVARAMELGPEYCVEIKGKVNERPPKQIKEGDPTGNVEIEALDLKVLNKSATPPFEIAEENTEKEESREAYRLKYRYLDLRREKMQKNIKLRHDVIRFFREYLYKQDFWEIETPYMSKSTPEGARDYLVPARNFPGLFYSLAQSPQQYKQMLMVAGMERYFQIARCFRDEDARGDRQAEFTQLDIEVSFADQEDIMKLVEDMLIKLVEKVSPEKKLSIKPFVKMTYKEAMDKYKTDRPDIRENKEDKDELAFCWVTDFPMFEKREDGSWAAVHHPFTQIREDDKDKIFEGKLEEVEALQYDLVLNGEEIFGGSVRNPDPKLLADVFAAMGHSKKDVQEQFGHLLEAFKYGVPPHAGIAAGLDRIVMILAGAENIRDVMAFPKTLEGRDMMMEAPAEVSKSQLNELGIQIRPKP
ncbi:aspartate--tRNA ligase [Patescibacteria group bacterium]|nr:aspartate--tRNA ligase [Patescibacteria group bacterium]MBU1673947.1 aspartate--tRNA ligase [Patescibacteria group bacterium]MBU1963941.1 aspartate--tRNA ligase [Patescibacteria group bacterium]